MSTKIEVRDERLSTQLHDINYTVSWSEGECTVHFSELWKLFEFAGKTTIREALEPLKLECIDVLQTVKKAKYQYMNAHPKEIEPVVAPLKAEKYLYLYHAIDDPSRVAALPKDKAAMFLKEYIVDLFRAIEYWKVPDRIEIWLNMTRSNGLIEFIQRSRFCFDVIPESFLQRHGVFLKPGKVLDLVLKAGYNKEVFASYFQEELLKNLPDLESVQVSNTPSEVYVKNGSFESCMKDKPGHYFRIYDDIDNCKIAYIVDEYDTLLARALLWQDVYDDITGNTIPKLMDRIYYHSQKELATMKMWAKKHGYLHKVQQKLNEDRWYTPTMELVKLEELSVETGFELTDNYYDAVPYVDTFNVAVRKEAKLFSYTPETDEVTVEMLSLKGHADWLAEGDVYRCTECNIVIENEEDCSWYENDPYCEGCFDRKFTMCDQCGEPYREINIGDFDGEYHCYCESCTRRLGFEYESWTDGWHSDLVRALILNRKTREIETISISQERINSDNVYDWRMCLSCSTWYAEEVTGKNYRCRNCQEDEE